MVLSSIGWVLLGLLALVVLVLVLPATATVRYSPQGLFVWVRVLFVRVRLYPRKPRREKKKKDTRKKKPKEQAPKDEKRPEEKKQQTFGEKFVAMKRLANAGLAAIKVLLKHIRIKKVQVILPVHAEDASVTATRCGRIQAAVGTLRAFLDGRLKVCFKRLQIFPDFAGQLQDERFFACKVVVNPVILFGMGFAFLKIFLRRRPYSKKAYKQALAEKRARAAQNGGKAA